jgi:hypothetical protein
MMDGRFPELNSNFESMSVRNMFWIGANSQGRRFKQDTSGFIHGFRYLVQVTLRILEAREFGNRLSTPGRLVRRRGCEPAFLPHAPAFKPFRLLFLCVLGA